jgi:hypothetical protein
MGVGRRPRDRKPDHPLQVLPRYPPNMNAAAEGIKLGLKIHENKHLLACQIGAMNCYLKPTGPISMFTRIRKGQACYASIFRKVFQYSHPLHRSVR